MSNARLCVVVFILHILSRKQLKCTRNGSKLDVQGCVLSNNVLFKASSNNLLDINTTLSGNGREISDFADIACLPYHKYCSPS